jgi:hypothetical protein
MGNCILCDDDLKNVYIPVQEDQIYQSPDHTFITTFGVVPNIVPPTPYNSPPGPR